MTADYYQLAKALAFQAPAICLIVCGYMFFSLRRNGMTSGQFVTMRLMIVGCICSMISEIVSGLFYFGLFDVGKVFVISSYNSAYFFMFANTMLLSEFCISRLDCSDMFLCKIIRASYFVVIAILISRIVFIRTELFTYIKDNGTLSFGPLDDIQTYGCVAIDALLTVLLLKKYRDTNEYVNRENIGKMLFASAAVTIILLIYVLTYIPYISWMGNMLVLMIFISGFQRLMIDHDELTSLYNRRRLLKDIELKNTERTAWSYIIFDLNLFKQINDKFGHFEGDKALKIVANVLNYAAIINKGHAYRIGGDEFAVLVPIADKDNLETICMEIERQIADEVSTEQLPYDVTLSYGYSIYGEHSELNVQSIMETADARMYKNKQEKHKKLG